MPRLPTEDKNEQRDYAVFTQELWNGLDGWYGFWSQRWRRTMDYLRSQHWKALQELDMSQIPDWRRFPVVNFTMALYGDYLKSWMQSRVRFSAIPESPEQEDLSAAEMADYALRYAWDVLDMETKRIELGSWLIATGNAAVRVFWDTDTGNMVPLANPGPDGTLIPLDPQTLQPAPQMMQPMLVDAGEIGIEVLSPQAVRRPTSRQHGVMVGFTVSYDDAVGRYGAEVAETLSYGATSGQALSLDLLNPLTLYGGDTSEDRALIVEHYLPRSRRYPDGLWWSASKELLVTQPAPLPAGRVPVVSFRWVPVPGHPFFGLSPLYDITFTNKLYDEMLARTQEWANKIVPKTLLPAGSGLRPGDFTDQPGQEIPYQPGAEPTYTAMPEPPRIFEQIRQEAREDILTVGGYRFTKPQELPAGESTQRTRKPPEMINQGQEVALAHLNGKASWEELGYIVLSYIGKYYDDDRVASILGPDRQFQWREFKASALNNLRARIRVDEIPLYPWNRQSMQDAVIGLLNTNGGQMMFMGADGQLDRDKLDAAIQAVGLDTVVSNTDPDMLEARNENYAFRSLQEGQQAPQVMPWQNDQAHLQEHTKELKTLSFSAWPEPRKQAFLEHTSAHEKRISEAQQGAQQAMLQQEQQLRQIKSMADTEENVRTAAGEKFIELITDVIKEAIVQGIAPKTPTKEKP